MPNYTKKLRDILSRSLNDGVASNYSDAVDLNSWIGVLDHPLTRLALAQHPLTRNLGILGGKAGDAAVVAADHVSHWLFGKKEIPTALSNCTLTATLWVDPTTPISRALTIIDDGNKYGYVEIPEAHLRPGDLAIATNPSNNAHHTMLVHGFTSGQLSHRFNGKNYLLPADHPLVRYSTGTTHPSGFRRSVGLMEYLDNSEGKTDVKYYRHYSPGESETLLPEIVVTPNGNYVPKGLKTIYIKR